MGLLFSTGQPRLRVSVEGQDIMNRLIRLKNQAKAGMGVALLVVMAGCAAYVGPDGGADVAVAAPDVYVGGVWEGGYHHDAHAWSHRGAWSRGYARHR